MRKAARAIIFQGNKILVMRRNKQAGDYFTLVGGRINENESAEQAVAREVQEETGLQVSNARLVYFEEHPAPYNEQYIFLCEALPSEEVKIQDASEEALLNKLDYDIHEPLWVDSATFARLPFRTPQLQTAIVQSMSKGFPAEPVKL